MPDTLSSLIAKLGDCPKTKRLLKYDTYDVAYGELADAALLELASKLREKTWLLETHEPHGHNVTNEQYVNCLNRAEAERDELEKALASILQSKKTIDGFSTKMYQMTADSSFKV